MYIPDRLKTKVQKMKQTNKKKIARALKLAERIRRKNT